MTWLAALGCVWVASLLTLLLRVAHKFWLSVVWSCVWTHGVIVNQLLQLHYPDFALPLTIANGIVATLFAGLDQPLRSMQMLIVKRLFET